MMRVIREGVACNDCLVLIANGEWTPEDRPAPEIGPHVHGDCSPGDGDPEDNYRCFYDVATCDYCDLGRNPGTYHPTVELGPVSKWAQDIIDDALQQALSTILWQGRDGTEEELSAGGSGYSGDPEDTSVYPDAERDKVRRALVDWLEDHARAIMDSDDDDVATVWHDDSGQLGHDWVLSGFGHGTGFWDRHASDTPEGRIGDKLHESTKCTVPDLMWEIEPGRWFTS